MGNLRQRAKELGIFLRGFIKEPLRVGTLHSTVFMARTLDRALRGAELDDHCVVEIGAGCGRLTEKIIEKLGADTQLLCFETEPLYANYLRRKFGGDPRVSVIEDRGERLPVYLERYGLKSVPTIVSTVPMSARKKNTRLLRTIYDSLSEGGHLVQMALVRRRYFEREKFNYLRRHVCLLHVPPEILHVCQKSSAAPIEQACAR